MSAPVIRRRERTGIELADLHPVVARVMAGRGITSAAELEPSLAHLHPPTIAGLEAAVARLITAFDAGESILIVGDFDADGATSVALAVRALQGLGFGRVDYVVPTRFESGYGLTPELVDIVAPWGADLLVTVDNGIAAFDGVRRAREHGIDTIVTDHHLPEAELPDAAAVVDPNRPDCGFQSKSLAGVGVTFYWLCALRTRLVESGRVAADGEGLPRMAGFLDLVALGTVADVVPLDRNNRVLVEQGLRRIRAGRASPGVAALLEVAGRRPEVATASDLGYAAAPRLNAAGRLGDMRVGIETLLASEAGPAGEGAQRLDALNRQRREIESEMRAQAEEELDRLRATLAADSALPAAVTLYDGRWHEGVVGILAGRVRAAVHRPVALFADAEDGALKGSVRSIEGLHIRDVLARVDRRAPGVIHRFGGHAMAAGLTIAADALEDFRRAFSEAVAETLGTDRPVQEIVTDGPLAPDELTLATAEALRRAGPWGAGFPEPLFDGEFEVHSCRQVGGEHLKLNVVPVDGTGALEAMIFRAAPDDRVSKGERVQLAYRLTVNEYRGRRQPELVVEHVARTR